MGGNGSIILNSGVDLTELSRPGVEWTENGFKQTKYKKKVEFSHKFLLIIFLFKRNSIFILGLRPLNPYIIKLLISLLTY